MSENMTEGTKVCGCYWRNMRFYYASVAAFTVMALGIVAIITLVGTTDTGAFIVYVFIDFAVVIVFLLMFGLLDHFCCTDDQVTTKEPERRAMKRTNEGALVTTSTSPIKTNHAGHTYSTSRGIGSTTNFAATANCVTGGDGGCVGDTSCSAD